MLKKKILFIGLLFLGIMLVCFGFFVFTGEGYRELSGLCIGMGAGLFGMSIAQLITIWTIEKRPQIRRQMEIDARDERTRLINDMARSKAFRAMEFMFPFAVVSILWGWMSAAALLVIIGVYVIGWVTYFLYLGKYAKEM